MKRTLIATCTVAGLVLFACPFDSTLREYLSVRFWLPFSKSGAHFLKKNVRRTNVRFAGIFPDKTAGALADLRRAYTQIADIEGSPLSADELAKLVTAARTDRSLTGQQREEVELVDAKIAMRLSQTAGDGRALGIARNKYETFLRTARDPDYRSEARGWLARVLFLQGDQTAAGKMYLDELNRNSSNLSNETLLNSLRIVYGYDGGPKLREHLAEYFDTPEHAAFAIQLATNPRWRDREQSMMQWRGDDSTPTLEPTQKTYVRIRELLNQHAELLSRNPNENGLPMLALRTALRMGDIAGAAKIADEIPTGSSLHSQADFLWTLASVRFLSHSYAAAEKPLAALFNLKSAEEGKRAAAAYGLCGVYQKLNRPVDQLQYALWLQEVKPEGELGLGLSDMSIYYAYSGWDLNLLLEFEAPIEAMETFVERNPKLRGIDRVRYAIAVRLGRQNRYDEAAALYRALGASGRAVRMRRLAELTRAIEVKTEDYEARFRLAEYINSNGEALYFNDRIWDGYQRYVFQGTAEVRLNRAERERLVAGERKLKDDQEEHWRAYLILRGIVKDAGPTPLGRKSALLAINCLRRLSDRFGREEEIRHADVELSQWLQR